MSGIHHRPDVQHAIMVGTTKVIFNLPTSKGIVNDVDWDEETGLCWDEAAEAAAEIASWEAAAAKEE